ncbi:MAG: GNAT family N-acetyltransferase [Verrucomicrobium sp.]
MASSTIDPDPVSPVVRLATPEDELALAALLLRCRYATFHWRTPDSFSLTDFAIETAGEKIWVATLESGELVGFISVWMPEHFIHHLYVEPDRQRLGIGKMLLAAVLQSAPATWSLKCAIKNVPALSFYEGQGWKIVGRGEDIGSDYYLMLSPALPDVPAS